MRFDELFFDVNERINYRRSEEAKLIRLSAQSMIKTNYVVSVDIFINTFLRHSSQINDIMGSVLNSFLTYCILSN